MAIKSMLGGLVCGVVGIGMCIGCASTVQVRDVAGSGFLKTYAQLRTGTDDQALLVYINPQAHFARYDKVVLYPVTIWRGADSALDRIPPDELQRLVDQLEHVLRQNLQADYSLVDRPEPGAMLVRAALTEADDSEIVLDTVSNVLPPAIALNLLKKIATGTSSFVGSARIEVEILDAVTAERLVAAVDARAGTKSFQGKFDKWDDVHQAFDYWAKRLQTRLREMRTNQP